MGSDMFVALGQATVDGHTYFAQNSGQLAGQSETLCLTPRRQFTPGDAIAIFQEKPAEIVNLRRLQPARTQQAFQRQLHAFLRFTNDYVPGFGLHGVGQQIEPLSCLPNRTARE